MLAIVKQLPAICTVWVWWHSCWTVKMIWIVPNVWNLVRKCSSHLNETRMLMNCFSIISFGTWFSRKYCWRYNTILWCVQGRQKTTWNGRNAGNFQIDCAARWTSYGIVWGMCLITKIKRITIDTHKMANNTEILIDESCLTFSK